MSLGATSHTSHLSTISSKPFDHNNLWLILMVVDDEGYVPEKSSPILEHHLMFQMTVFLGFGVTVVCG